MNVKTQTQLWIRDASQDHQPEIHSTLRREDVQRIMGPTNKDCRFWIFILKNSLHQQHLLVGRYDSKLRYVLVHNFLRKLCYGSKKWRWLNQWQELVDARVASALNRIMQNTRFKKKVSQSGGNESPKRGPLSPRKTDCFLDLRILPGHWGQRFCRELYRPIYSCSSK